MQDFVVTQDAFARFLAHFHRVVAWDNLKIVTVRLNPAAIGATEHFKADNLPQSTVGNIKMHHYLKILFELLLKAVYAVDSLVQFLQKRCIFISNQLVKKVLLIAEVFIDSSLAYQPGLLFHRAWLFHSHAAKKLLPLPAKFLYP